MYSHLELAPQKKIFPKEQAKLRICESKKEKKEKNPQIFHATLLLD